MERFKAEMNRMMGDVGMVERKRGNGEKIDRKKEYNA